MVLESLNNTPASKTKPSDGHSSSISKNQQKSKDPVSATTEALEKLSPTDTVDGSSADKTYSSLTEELDDLKKKLALSESKYIDVVLNMSDKLMSLQSEIEALKKTNELLVMEHKLEIVKLEKEAEASNIRLREVGLAFMQERFDTMTTDRDEIGIRFIKLESQLPRGVDYKVYGFSEYDFVQGVNLTNPSRYIKFTSDLYDFNKEIIADIIGLDIKVRHVPDLGPLLARAEVIVKKWGDKPWFKKTDKHCNYANSPMDHDFEVSRMVARIVIIHCFEQNHLPIVCPPMADPYTNICIQDLLDYFRITYNVYIARGI